MNIIPTSNITFTSQQHELYFSPKVAGKRTNTVDDDDVAMLYSGPNKKVRIMSIASSSGRWSLDASTVHSQSDNQLILPCSSGNDAIINGPKSTFLSISPPMLNVATFRTDNDSMTSTISTINTYTNTNHIDWVELQLEFLRTLKKLDKSMQRTDQSRIFFMRAMYKQHHHHMDDNGLRYFTSPEWYKKQQDRDRKSVV